MHDEHDKTTPSGGAPDPARAAVEEGAAGREPSKESGRDFTEEFKVAGEAVVAKVKELVREGNVRRIIIKNEEGRVLMEFPLTVGVIGTLLLPQFAALGAIAGLIANLTIAVERRTAPGDAPVVDADDAPSS